MADIQVHPVSDPGWDKTTWVDAIDFNLGGNGANTSYALATLGVQVGLFSVVGQDDFGCEVLKKLTAAGVDVSRVQRLEGQATPVSVVLVHPNGKRGLLHCPGASREAFRDGIDLSEQAIQGSSHLHLANLFTLQSFQKHAAALLQRARELGLCTSVDTGWDPQGLWLKTLEPCLPFTDLLFVNEDEARQLTGASEPDWAAERLRKGGARDVIVKLGAQGCLVKTASERLLVRGFCVDVVDTTGAGDCFSAGFIAALQHGFDYRQAARFANAVGAMSVSSLGAVNGLRSFDETIAWTFGQGR